MKKKMCIFVVALLALVVSDVWAQVEPVNDGVKIMSYNIHNTVGLDDVADVERIADVMRNSGADVVAVQEVDSVTGRSGGRYYLGDLASATSLHPTFAAAIDFDGGKYGIGILSKKEPLTVRRIPLPGREESRVLLVAEFPQYVVAGVHLSLTEEDCMASVEIIHAEAERWTKPFLLAGDWNITMQSEVFKAISQYFHILNDPTQSTYPADEPTECIDFIALYKPTGDKLLCTGTEVIDEKVASDHRPVLAKLQINASLVLPLK